MSGGDRTPTIVINELLCSILKAKSRFSDLKELVGVIVRKVSKDEIKDAWKQLFTVYAKVEDSILKKPIIEIAKTSSKVMLEDILKLFLT